MANTDLVVRKVVRNDARKGEIRIGSHLPARQRRRGAGPVGILFFPLKLIFVRAPMAVIGHFAGREDRARRRLRAHLDWK